MKLSKKVMLVALFAIIAFSMVFVGCSKKNSEPETVVLNIMGYGDNSNSEGATFKRICDEFMAEYPDIKVNYELLYDEAYHQKAVARLAAGDVPDIAYMGADARWGATWQEGGQQVDNTPFYPADIDASLVPDFFGTGVKPYLPMGGSNFCTVVGVNMKLLEEIGGKLPTTYAEFVELAKLCKANGIECLSTHGADSWVWGSCVMSGIIPRTTGDLTWIEKAIAGEVKFTDPGFVAALDVLSQWVKDGIISKDSVLVDNGTGISNFANGKYLMYIDGQWGFGETNYGDMSKDIKLIPIPAVPGEIGNAGSIAGAWQVGYGITKKGASDAKVLEAAKKWLAYYFSYEETLQRLADGAISAPILKDFVTPEGMDPLIAEKGKLGAYPSAFVIDSYLTGAANDALNAGMQDIVAGKMTGADLAAVVQKAFDAQ
jgi:raffinose/stachyose/melibiose transport system substrate-binding protein